LWEVTTQTQHSGEPILPHSTIATSTQDQIAAMDARTKATWATTSAPHVAKVCFTPASIVAGQRQLALLHQLAQQPASSTNENCAETNDSISCKDGAPRMEFAYDSQHISVNMQSNFSAGGRTMVVTTILQSHWLAADCGEVPPATGLPLGK
jgi:Protein of unknown function (DUF3617)